MGTAVKAGIQYRHYRMRKMREPQCKHHRLYYRYTRYSENTGTYR